MPVSPDGDRPVQLQQLRITDVEQAVVGHEDVIEDQQLV